MTAQVLPFLLYTLQQKGSQSFGYAYFLLLRLKQKSLRLNHHLTPNLTPEIIENKKGVEIGDIVDLLNLINIPSPPPCPTILKKNVLTA